MAINIFNYTNQKLSADNLRKLNNFSSNNYGGIITLDNKSPIHIDGKNIMWDIPFNMVCGGLTLSITDIPTQLQENELLMLSVDLSDVNLANVTSDVLNNKCSIFKTLLTTFTIDEDYSTLSKINAIQSPTSVIPYQLGWYEEVEGNFVQTEDSEYDENKVYYDRVIGSTFSFNYNYNGTMFNFKYDGNTLWTSKTSFIIPLVINVGGQCKQLVACRNMSDFSGLLSASNYARLKAFIENSFVWTEGGKKLVDEKSGKPHSKGDIGLLNITENKISNNGRSYIRTINEDGEVEYKTTSNNGAVIIDNPSLSNVEIYKGDLVSIGYSNDELLVLEANGNVSKTSSSFTLPIGRGGTGASNKQNAKKNLGFNYGTANPKTSNIAGQEGDVYFWIVE